MHQIGSGEDRIKYALRVSKKAKNIGIKITPHDGVVLVVPEGASQTKAIQFLQKKARWIKRHMPKEVDHGSQDEIQIMGDKLNIVEKRHSLKRPKVRIEDGCMTVYQREEDLEQKVGAIKEFVKRYAKLHLSERVELLAAEKNLEIANVCIKEQNGRWGSCSSKRNINLNWRLVMAPLQIIDAVIFHELAHLTHMNHSRDFWSLLISYDGNAKENDKWLKKHGNQILASFRD